MPAVIDQVFYVRPLEMKSSSFIQQVKSAYFLNLSQLFSRWKL